MRFSPAKVCQMQAASGHSPEQTAANLGITYWHYYALMHGRKRPSLDMLIRLAEEFGCNPGDLFGADEDHAA
jgi:hypothetical protein